MKATSKQCDGNCGGTRKCRVRAYAEAPPKKRTRKPAGPSPVEERRTVPCKICKAKIEFTAGLDEMAAHWETEHPEALAKMREGHAPSVDRSGW